MCEILYISEQHIKNKLVDNSFPFHKISFELIKPKYFYHKKDLVCFQLYNENENYSVDTNYFIGVDWLIPEKYAIYVEPKLNNENQVDFLGMLHASLKEAENLEHLDGLFHIEFDKPWITIPSQKDVLSPILIIQFLKLVQKIVRKGLKKSYYRITENLNGRVKGNILVAQQIKTNIVKNRLTNTVCNYQEYGTNMEENQFLKFVLQYVSSYINQNNNHFGQDYDSLKNILQYCSPAFDKVSLPKNKHHVLHQKKNPFFKEYEEAIKIGNHILKRFSFNLNKISESQTTVPPFWIDMSKLFELYVYRKLKKVCPEPNSVSYHDKFKGGKETDILIKAEGYQCVVDCKYKPHYGNQDPTLEDKRQLAGYTRLKSVYSKLGLKDNTIVKGLIVYSHQSCSESFKKEELFKTPIHEYVDFYKLGIGLPEINREIT